MKKKIWALTFIVFAIAVFTIIFVNKDDNVYSEENCLETYIPCVNAFTDKNIVKVFNGTSSLDRGDGTSIYADFFKGDVDRRQLEVLKVDINEVVTLEFINKKPQSISVYQLDGNEREKEIDITQHSFIAPDKSGIYKYELFGEYLNGNVHHYLKIKVK